MTNKDSFETSLEELEELVEKLEGGKLSLDQSIELFDRGISLYKKCRNTLDVAEKKITRLTESLKEEEFNDK